VKLRLALFVLLALVGGRARAQDLKDRVNFRIGLTGMYLREDQPNENDPTRKAAGPLSLAYGDLRLVLDARRLPGNFELHVDGRVRMTGGAIQTGTTDITGSGTTSAPTNPPTYTANSLVTSRGYLGGREYQINELWARGRWAKADLGIGRLLIPEADAMRLDGVRFWIHANKRWDVTVYGGTYPDPYSRSIDTDYGHTLGTGGIAGGGGVSANYNYERIYGAFSGNAIYLGSGDGGDKLTFDAKGNPALSGKSALDSIRSFITWQNFWRPIKYLDFYHDLVLDVAGAAGVQLSRLDFFAAGHVNKYFTLRVGYDHMSSIAIEMYLSKLLANRTEFLPNTLDNNLVLSRTARDEGRVAAEVQFGTTTITGEGRLRRRVLATPSNDPQFVYQPGTSNAGAQVAPTLGWDATLAVRNRGSLAGLRPSFWFTYLHDYRARDIYVGVGVGREFWNDRISLDIGLTYANTHDDQIDGGNVCNAGTTAPIAPTSTTTLYSCYGTRSGHNIQPTVTLAVSPAKHWFVLFDYRMGLALSSDVNVTVPTGMTPPPPYVVPYVITNTLLARVEARY
jgi:hypothetical protein